MARAVASVAVAPHAAAHQRWRRRAHRRRGWRGLLLARFARTERWKHQQLQVGREEPSRGATKHGKGQR
jgi:hypothetical protein